MMSGESLVVDPVRAPRLGLPAGWVADLDDGTAQAWDMVSAGIPEVPFPSRDELFKAGLMILLVEATAFHRRAASRRPQKYWPDLHRPHQGRAGNPAGHFAERNTPRAPSVAREP